MPLPSSVVGASVAPRTREIDARWLMAYGAGLGDTHACYLDTTRPGGIVGHPLFPVCLEWDLVLAARDLVPRDVLSRDELLRGVHATHDLQIHRLVRPGDVLTTTATVEGVERRRPGAYESLRLDTVDADGRPVSTTRMGSLFLGVDVDGPDRRGPARGPDPAVTPATAPTGTTPWHTIREIGPTAAHVYTECSRIWNPIHTDPAAAAAAGLPGIILHGTATLALAISAVVDEFADGDPARVRAVRGRFGAMVRLPSRITVTAGPAPDGTITGQVSNADGDAAIRDLRLALGD